MQRARSLYALEDVNHVARRNAKRVEASDNFRQGGATVDLGKPGAGFFVYIHIGARHDHGFTFRKWVGLHDKGRLLHP